MKKNKGHSLSIRLKTIMQWGRNWRVRELFETRQGTVLVGGSMCPRTQTFPPSRKALEQSLLMRVVLWKEGRVWGSERSEVWRKQGVWSGELVDQFRNLPSHRHWFIYSCEHAHEPAYIHSIIQHAIECWQPARLQRDSSRHLEGGHLPSVPISLSSFPLLLEQSLVSGGGVWTETNDYRANIYNTSCIGVTLQCTRPSLDVFNDSAYFSVMEEVAITTVNFHL